MAFRIVFSDDGIETLISAASFIENKWGVKQVQKFLERIDKILSLVSQNPYMFKPFMLSNNTRVAIVSKQTSVIYRVLDDEIVILFFWDNRQDAIFTN